MTESIKHGEMIRKDYSLNKLKKKETLRRQACCLILMISALISARFFVSVVFSDVGDSP